MTRACTSFFQPLKRARASGLEYLAEARTEAAAAPKGTDVRVYQAGHELSEESTRERLAWLRQKLALPPSR